MEGFGIHTYRMINAQGKACFVRFHWKPLCGTASLIWDEAQELAGRDPDFHRKDLWHAIENGHFPEFELGLQIIPEQEEHAFDFDILDATKLIPEALVPVQKIGKMVLNRNPDNFFAETEQIAFCPANIVPGIDFSDDPLLQGRLFAYTDSQRYRLGGPNFTELPINRPLVPVRNQQRDGAHRMQIDVSAANYQPNSLDGNWPCEVPSASHHGGFASFPTPTEGIKIRQRSASFADHFSQPRLFWRSQTRSEQLHIIQAFAFELGNVRHIEIRERVIDLLAHIDHGLAQAVASRLGISLTQEQRSYPLPEAVHGLEKDPSLSLYAHGKQSLKARRVAILADNGVCQQCIDTILPALQEQGIHACILAPQAGHILTTMDTRLAVDGTVGNTSSVLFDALVIPGGTESLHSLKTHTCTRRYLCQTYRHLKPIALADGAELLLAHTGIPEAMLHNDVGIIHKEDIRQTMEAFLNVLTRHRIWEREEHLVNALQA
jgi:catalase